MTYADPMVRQRYSGLLFELLERYVIERYGEVALERALRTCGAHADEPWLSPFHYDAEQWWALLDATLALDQLSRQALLNDFARWSTLKLLDRYHGVASGYSNSLELLAEFRGSILPQLNRFRRVSDIPDFDYHRVDHVHGHIALPAADMGWQLALEGIVQGLGEHFGEHVTLSPNMDDENDLDHLHFDLSLAAKETA